jgi:hypothetical protein
VQACRDGYDFSREAGSSISRDRQYLRISTVQLDLRTILYMSQIKIDNA